MILVSPKYFRRIKLTIWWFVTSSSNTSIESITQVRKTYFNPFRSWYSSGCNPFSSITVQGSKNQKWIPDFFPSFPLFEICNLESRSKNFQSLKTYNPSRFQKPQRIPSTFYSSDWIDFLTDHLLFLSFYFLIVTMIQPLTWDLKISIFLSTQLPSYEIEHDSSVTQKDVYQSCEIPCDN